MKATRNSWKNKPMPDQHTDLTLELHLNAEELERLKLGSIPQEMEDHWFLFYEDGRFYCIRSWTGTCIYIAEVCENGDILHAAVNRDSSQYTCTDDTKDISLLKHLILSCAGRDAEASAALFAAIKQ